MPDALYPPQISNPKSYLYMRPPPSSTMCTARPLSKMNNLPFPLIPVSALLLIFLLPCESTRKTIDETCKKTKNYSLCVSTLESDPRSATTDPAGLANISLEILRGKANATLREAIKLYTGAGSDPVVYQFYGTCIDVYLVSVTRLLPNAARELGSKKFSEARGDVTEVASNAQTCGRQFVGRSDPIISPNADVHDLATVVSDIIGSLG